ncbi:hypothetical protein ACLOJK_018599 [Asimina triloba]
MHRWSTNVRCSTISPRQPAMAASVPTHSEIRVRRSAAYGATSDDEQVASSSPSASGRNPWRGGGKLQQQVADSMASGDDSVGKLQQRAARSGVFSGSVNRPEGCSGVAWRRRTASATTSGLRQATALHLIAMTDLDRPRPNHLPNHHASMFPHLHGIIQA